MCFIFIFVEESDFKNESKRCILDILCYIEENPNETNLKLEDISTKSQEIIYDLCDELKRPLKLYEQESLEAKLSRLGGGLVLLKNVENYR